MATSFKVGEVVRLPMEYLRSSSLVPNHGSALDTSSMMLSSVKEEKESSRATTPVQTSSHRANEPAKVDSGTIATPEQRCHAPSEDAAGGIGRRLSRTLNLRHFRSRSIVEADSHEDGTGVGFGSLIPAPSRKRVSQERSQSVEDVQNRRRSNSLRSFRYREQSAA
ncbi:unnamed protein product [Parajaminaea phylloscopi]